MASMYRSITATALHQYDIEAYELDERRARLMLDMPMSVAVGALVFFYTIGRAFAIDMRSYLNQSEGAESSDEFRTKWGWYRVIYSLADGDILRIPSVTRILLDEAFTFLAYQIDLKPKNPSN